jgi:energy-coupling factor transporter ATP-binding protein EcfA2
MNFHLEDIHFSYNDTPIFIHLDLTIGSGECVAIVGEEGSGKSTLLQLMDAIHRPLGGRMLINGNDVWEQPKALHQVRRRVGFAFQFPEQQFFHETVSDELLFASKNFNLPGDDDGRKCLSVLRELDLDEAFMSRSPFSLSMGEARRVALAVSLVLDPDAFLLDEPTAGMDGFGFATVASLIERLKRRNKTVVFASHDHDIIQAVASRVVLLEDGEARDV